MAMAANTELFTEIDALELGAHNRAWREAARTFEKTAAPAMTYKAWESIAGSWARDAEAAKLKDPTLDSAIYGQTTSALLWKKILSVGLRAFVSEAKDKIDGYVNSEGADAGKIYFWRSAVISLEAVIRHARRYAALAEAQGREEMAETLRRVPEFPARNLREALQSMVICNVCKMLEHPMQNNSHWARADQYLYEYFMNDLKNGVPRQRETDGPADGRPEKFQRLRRALRGVPRAA
jgi:formate C-acetyltransferase